MAKFLQSDDLSHFKDFSLFYLWQKKKTPGCCQSWGLCAVQKLKKKRKERNGNGNKTQLIIGCTCNGSGNTCGLRFCCRLLSVFFSVEPQPFQGQPESFPLFSCYNLRNLPVFASSCIKSPIQPLKTGQRTRIFDHTEVQVKWGRNYMATTAICPEGQTSCGQWQS